MEMQELTGAQMLFYGVEKAGAGQGLILCGGVYVPRVIWESDLQRAANEVFRINDGLRARYVEKDGKVYQETMPFMERKFEVLRFNNKKEMDEWGEVYATVPMKIEVRKEGEGLPKDTWATSKPSKTLIKNILLHNAKTEFHKKRYGIKVESGVCEIKLVQLPGATGAIVKMHHLVSDAWSVLLVANQLLKILNGEMPEAYQYDEHLRYRETYKKSKRYQKDLTFINDMLARCPEPTVVWPRPFDSLESYRTTVEIDKDFTSKLQEYAASHGTSPYVMFLLGVGIFESRKLHREDVYVGTVALNRAGVHEKNTVGLFVNSVPMLLNLKGDLTFADAVKHVHSTNIACFKHQRGRDENDHGKMLYDIWVSYQNATLSADEDAICTQYYNKSASIMKVLTIDDHMGKGTLNLHFDCNVNVAPSEVDEMFNLIFKALREGMEDDSKKLSDLSV